MPTDCYSNIFCLGATPLPTPTPPIPTETPAPTNTPPPTETPFIFDADYILLTYEFLDGADLDTRTRIVTPDVGQNAQTNYIGWGVSFSWSNSESFILDWGGDNTSTGFESVLVNLTEFKAQYPEDTIIVLDLRAFWYNTVGIQPVTVSATLWKGGTPIKQGSEGSPAYSFTNPTATNTFNISSAGKVITLFPEGNKAISSGERVATFTYDLIANEGLFNSDDTTTPSV